MWVRGLKRDVKAASVYCAKVAPYVGAWIETNKDKEQEQEELVAPYVGAWIETQTTMNSAKYMYVAPYVGAWIETIYGEDTCLSHCRTLCGCVD